MDFITVLTSTVVFLFSVVGGTEVPIGTGFLVGIPVSANKADGMVPVVVTSRHVIAGETSVVVRFNTKSGAKPFKVIYDLAAMKTTGDVWFHPDSGVDLAVFRTLNFEDTDFSSVTPSHIATKGTFRDEDIKATDRILFPSLLRDFMGQSRNYPVVRDGSIALIPAEPVPMRYSVGSTKISTSQEVVMLNANSFPGASGSPVFLWPGGRVKHNSVNLSGGRSYLVGIMQGFYSAEGKEIREINVNTTKRVFEENSGIAVVVPSWRLTEIIDSPAVRLRIKQVIAEATKVKPPETTQPQPSPSK